MCVSCVAIVFKMNFLLLPCANKYMMIEEFLDSEKAVQTCRPIVHVSVVV